MNINSFTSAGTAASVWASVSRTLTADPATDAGAAALVWAHAPTRQLTSMGTTAMVTISALNQTLAASATVDLRPAAGKMREIAIRLRAGAAQSSVIQIFDGTQTDPIATAAAGGGVAVGICVGTSACGPRLQNNDGANSGGYGYAGVDWTQ